MREHENEKIKKGLVSLELPSGDTVHYILHEGINSNDILSILANSKYPNQLIKDIGTRVDDAEFAEMEQSKECMFSIDYAIGDNYAILYEINGGRGGISEREITDFKSAHIGKSTEVMSGGIEYELEI